MLTTHNVTLTSNIIIIFVVNNGIIINYVENLKSTLYGYLCHCYHDHVLQFASKQDLSKIK